MLFFKIKHGTAQPNLVKSFQGIKENTSNLIATTKKIRTFLDLFIGFGWYLELNPDWFYEIRSLSMVNLNVLLNISFLKILPQVEEKLDGSFEDLFIAFFVNGTTLAFFYLLEIHQSPNIGKKYILKTGRLSYYRF